MGLNPWHGSQESRGPLYTRWAGVRFNSDELVVQPGMGRIFHDRPVGPTRGGENPSPHRCCYDRAHTDAREDDRRHGGDGCLGTQRIRERQDLCLGPQLGQLSWASAREASPGVALRLYRCCTTD